MYGITDCVTLQAHFECAKQSWNNPTNLTDPSGFAASDPCGGGIFCTVIKYVEKSFSDDAPPPQVKDVASATPIEQLKVVATGTTDTIAKGNVDKVATSDQKVEAGEQRVEVTGQRPSTAGAQGVQQIVIVGTPNLAAQITVKQVGNIVFNETRSLSGPHIDQARYNVARVVINGAVDATLHNRKRPQSAPLTATVPTTEMKTYDASQDAAALAASDYKDGKVDPTNGAKNFNFRSNDSKKDFQGHEIQTQIGPLDNSYPTNDLGKTVYANSYK